MYNVNIYTTLIIGKYMVTRWELGQGVIPVGATLNDLLSNIPADFFLNYLDYEVITGALVKIGTPLNETLTKAAVNNDYPLSVIRNTSMNIFASL